MNTLLIISEISMGLILILTIGGFGWMALKYASKLKI